MAKIGENFAFDRNAKNYKIVVTDFKTVNYYGVSEVHVLAPMQKELTAWIYNKDGIEKKGIRSILMDPISM